MSFISSVCTQNNVIRVPVTVAWHVLGLRACSCGG